MKYELEEIYKGIATVNSEIESRKLWNADPTLLSRENVRLSGYRTYLGAHLADKIIQYRNAKRNAYLDKRAEGLSSNQANIEASYETQNLKAEKEVLQLNYKALDGHISTIQSHLATLRSERTNTNEQHL